MLWGALLLLLIGAAVLIGRRVSNSVLKPRRFTCEKGVEHERKFFSWAEGEFEALEKESFTLTARDGAPLSCVWLSAAQKSNKAVVLAHGRGCCAVNSYKYAKLFLKRGFSALLFDFRYSGESGGKYSTLGFLERFDLMTAVDEAFRRLGENAIVGTHGESMGAASAILEACMDERLAFTVADCPFYDMREEIAHILKMSFKLPRFPFLALGALSLCLRAGVSMRAVSPLAQLVKKHGLPRIPMLFIHGKSDTYILPESTERLYAVKAGKKRLWLCENAEHARSIAVDPARYDAEIGAFLNELSL